jgi:hypothetical protein
MDNKQAISEDYYQFKAVDLSPYDLDATLFIPDETVGIGASFQTTIEHEEEFKWKVMAGPNFQLFSHFFSPEILCCGSDSTVRCNLGPVFDCQYWFHLPAT